MRLPFVADERAAMQFEDLASSLDAGLPMATLGGAKADDERCLHQALAARGVTLDPTEDAVLLAAFRAGRASEALRRRAEDRRRRARLHREFAGRLIYPIALMSFTVLTASIVGKLLHRAWFPYALAGVVAAMAVAAFVVRRGLRRGTSGWLRLPWLGPLAAGLAELPYLETLHGLYASGLPILEAHDVATGTVRATEVRLRLRDAERRLREGRPLAETLREARALHPETIELIENGERAGHLEEALARALTRRREVATHRLQASARWIAGAVYAFALLSAAYLILSFYGGYFSRSWLR